MLAGIESSPRQVRASDAKGRKEKV